MPTISTNGASGQLRMTTCTAAARVLLPTATAPVIPTMNGARAPLRARMTSAISTTVSMVCHCAAPDQYAPPKAPVILQDAAMRSVDVQLPVVRNGR